MSTPKMFGKCDFFSQIRRISNVTWTRSEMFFLRQKSCGVICGGQMDTKFVFLCGDTFKLSSETKNLCPLMKFSWTCGVMKLGNLYILGILVRNVFFREKKSKMLKKMTFLDQKLFFRKMFRDVIYKVQSAQK